MCCVNLLNQVSGVRISGQTSRVTRLSQGPLAIMSNLPQQFTATKEQFENGSVTKFKLFADSQPLSFREVIDLWQTAASFGVLFNSLLQDSPYQAFRWETPRCCTNSWSSPFEFVLIDSPSLVTRRPDVKTYDEYFERANADGIVSFMNYGGDALLISPTPVESEHRSYGHLAAFVRSAPVPQVQALWREVGKQMASRVADSPVWLNTHGGGVAWLHVRLDRTPKYYGFAPYRISK